MSEGQCRLTAVDPASATYVVGVPLFERFSMHFPGAARPLLVIAKGVTTGKRYLASLTIDGEQVTIPVITHGQLAQGAEIVFTMSSKPTPWGANDA